MASRTGSAALALSIVATAICLGCAQSQPFWANAVPDLVERTENVAISCEDAASNHCGWGRPVVFNIGGFVLDRVPVETVTVYSREGDGGTWTYGPSLPVGLHHAMVSRVGGDIYVMGGYKIDGGSIWGISDRVYVLRPNATAWASGPIMIAPVAAGTAQAIGDKIYVAGGVAIEGTSSNDAVTASLYALDTVTGAWSRLTAMTTPREHLASAIINGKLHVVAGRNGVNVNTHEVYDPVGRGWADAPPAPTARGGCGAVSVGSSLFVVGGEGSSTFPEVHRYDAADSKWYACPDLPTPRHGLGVAMIEAAVHVVGGGPTPGFSYSNKNEWFAVGPTSECGSLGGDDGDATSGSNGDASDGPWCCHALDASGGEARPSAGKMVVIVIGCSLCVIAAIALALALRSHRRQRHAISFGSHSVSSGSAFDGGSVSIKDLTAASVGANDRSSGGGGGGGGGLSGYGGRPSHRRPSHARSNSVSRSTMETFTSVTDDSDLFLMTSESDSGESSGPAQYTTSGVVTNMSASWVRSIGSDRSPTRGRPGSTDESTSSEMDTTLPRPIANYVREGSQLVELPVR